MNVPRHDMNLLKFVHVQAKPMKSICFYVHGVKVHSNSNIPKKRSTGSKHMNTLVASAVAKAPNLRKNMQGNHRMTPIQMLSLNILTPKVETLVRSPNWRETMATGNG